MRKLLLGLFLGLLAVVHSTPVTTVTEVPVNEDDVFREAMTDGFLVPSVTMKTPKTQPTVEASQQTESTRDSLLATEAPKTNATVPASQQPESEETTEGVTDNIRHGGYMTTTSTQETSSTAETTTSMQETLSTIETTTSMQEVSGSTETTTSMQEVSGSTETTTSMQEVSRSSETTTSESNPIELPAQSATVETFQQPFLDDVLDGSGFGETEGASTTLSWLGSSTTTTSTSTDSPVSSLSLDFGSEDDESTLHATVDSLGSDSGSGMMTEETVVEVRSPKYNMAEPETVVKTAAKIVENPDPEQHKGHSTPGWIIIVGFIVGVAALVMLCLAIATRDKWNGPRQASTTESETKQPDQQRGLEMETFLPREENGKAAEYTVIPLDELSESYS